jgi:hypothetical protein
VRFDLTIVSNRVLYLFFSAELKIAGGEVSVSMAAKDALAFRPLEQGSAGSLV